MDTITNSIYQKSRYPHVLARAIHNTLRVQFRRLVNIVSESHIGGGRLDELYDYLRHQQYPGVII